MKKITAFFMALFPFLIVGLLFATGLISKNFTDKIVQRIEMKQDVYTVQKQTDDTQEFDLSNTYRVIPEVARDRTVYWTCENPDLASVEKETGKVTINPLGYGDIKLHGTAKTNASATADCVLKVWDDKAHKIEITNKEQAGFINPGSSLQLQVKTIPSERIADPKLTYEIIEGKEQGFSVTPTGIVIASASANGEAVVKVTTSNGKSDTVTLNASRTVSSIGFANDGDVLTQGNTYNLYNGDDKVLTAPFDITTIEDPLKYLEFESSDPEHAPIGKKTGQITFNEGYVPGTFVTFTVKFAGLDSISATKRVASSLNYYSNVTFDDYSKTLQVDLTNPVDISAQAKYTTFPAKGDSSRLTLTSSNSDVVEIKNGIPYAKAEGKATLTIKAQVTASSVISDTLDLTIVNTNTPRLLNSQTLTVDKSRNYHLRDNLLSQYLNSKIEWKLAEATDAAVINDETITFTKVNTPVKVTATFTDGSISISNTCTLTCQYNTLTKVDVSSGEVTINAGDYVQFTKDGNPVLLQKVPEQLTLVDTNCYVANYGSQKVLTVTLADATTIKLTILEPLVGFSSTDGIDYTHYSTNATTFNAGSKFKTYPATSTVVESSWTGEVVTTPTISYKYKAEDDSAVDIKDNVITFSKPTSVTITCSYGDVSRSYVVTSCAGTNGKFSLVDNDGNVINNGDTLTDAIAPGIEFKCHISKYALKDVSVSETELKRFTIKSTSEDRIVKPNDPTLLQTGFVEFSFEAVSTGSDTLVISNGTFDFYIHVNVSKAITNIDLYCLGNQLKKNTNDSIPVYTTKDIILNMDFSPVVARDETLDITFNNVSWTAKPGSNLNISEGAKPEESKVITWKSSDVNTLTITYGANTSTYNFVVSTEAPDFEIVDSVETEAGKKYNYFLPAVLPFAPYAVMQIKADGVYSQEYFSEKFKVDTTAWADAKIYGKYIIGTAPEAGSSLTVNITDGSSNKSKEYTIKRDLVSKIELPKHNNLETSDAKGLQRVHTFGTQTQYTNEAKSDVYRLPITIYDAKEEMITDLAAKNAAMKTLVLPTTQGVESAVYNETTTCIDIKFKKDAANIYTDLEMVDNAFVSNPNKRQLFEIYTQYGQYHKTEQNYASYSFVVVNGVNVYDQKGITDALALAQDQRNIVLQTNFGPNAGAEEALFTLENGFSVHDLYGNGYSMNFDAFTKAHPSKYPCPGGLSAHVALNANLIGCEDATFETLTDRSCTWTEGGNNTEETQDIFAYCQFSRYFQTFTIWSNEQTDKYYYVKLKNCMFFNQAERCRVCLSISNPRCVATVESCAFFNPAKITMLVNKEATVRFKGDIDVYNFHSSDMFDGMGQGPEFSEWAWSLVLPMLEKADLVEGAEYGSTDKKVINSYLVTALTGYVQFYDHSEGGKDIFVEGTHGTEKAANYLKYGAGLQPLGVDIADIWSTVKPPLPLQFGHSPCYSDEFIKDSKGKMVLNTDVLNLLLYKISRW